LELLSRSLQANDKAVHSLKVVQQSRYKDDFNFSRLDPQLGMLADGIKVMQRFELLI